ncbi:hypothetical protein L2E82_06205 [Cichorium intybus]|uniref:Uncharacterized protein n=1 Tax=Cichorium intybus TaxID=13427 RepID=A0ACB9H987_CICIN|nr:hypothetical protein L2E82_06205 [Cichorium intybus]
MIAPPFSFIPQTRSKKLDFTASKTLDRPSTPRLIIEDKHLYVLPLELAGDVVQNLKDFFRSMYKKVTEDDIEEFESNYRGSESEKNDLIDLYKKYKGYSALCYAQILNLIHIDLKISKMKQFPLVRRREVDQSVPEKWLNKSLKQNHLLIH